MSSDGDEMGCSIAFGSKIPRFQRSRSLRLKGEVDVAQKVGVVRHFSNTLDGLRGLDDRKVPRNRKMSLGDCPLTQTSLPATPCSDMEDSDSVKSYCSAASLDALYTGWHIPGLKKKYVVHCSSHNHENEVYLTPTQRMERQIRHLKTLLLKARRENDDKDAEILRLTKELIELRLFKTEIQKNGKLENTCNVEMSAEKAVQSPSPILQQSQGKVAVKVSGLMTTSAASSDSGHFEPLAVNVCRDESTNTDGSRTIWMSTGNEPYPHFLEEVQQLKAKHNDHVENLLQKLSEANTRYSELRPLYDGALDRIREMEKLVDRLRSEVDQQDDRHHEMYLKMYKKGQEAARFEHADEVLEFAHKAPSRVNVAELLQQLHVTEHELERVKALYRRDVCKRADGGLKETEVTLKFLKDAVYYFLVDKDSKGHLKAIESIMGYSELEKMNIERVQSLKGKRI